MGYILENSEKYDFKKIKSSYKKSNNSSGRRTVSLRHFNIYKNRNNIRSMSRNYSAGELKYSKAAYMESIYNALSELKYADMVPFMYYRNGMAGVDDSCKFNTLRYINNSSENDRHVYRYEYSGR